MRTAETCKYSANTAADGMFKRRHVATDVIFKSQQPPMLERHVLMAYNARNMHITLAGPDFPLKPSYARHVGNTNPVF